MTLGKRILSFFVSLVMVLTNIVPAFAAGEEATNEVTETVTVHKILLAQDKLEAHDPNKEYDGNQIQNITEFFGDESAKEIAGVYFAVKNADGSKYIKADGTETNNVDEAIGGLTTEGGIALNTANLKGAYKIVEVPEKSTYVGAEGAVLTGSKAVPIEITLPLVNNDGVVTAAHVYPKNSEDKPLIDKNFAQGNDLKDVADTNNNSDVGAVYENYQKEKATVTAELGKEVPYEVKTQIPANSKLKTAKWDDKMTEGLTYKADSLKISVGEEQLAPEDYQLTQANNGFVLTLTESGLAKINNKESAVEVTLTYSATVNSSAVVDVPEANDIMFHYGNNPGFGTTPIPTNPNENGELEVVKTWDDGIWAEGEKATFKLVDANTGKDVTREDLVNAPEDYEFKGEVEIGYDAVDGGSYKWQYLDPEKEYKAVEISTTPGTDSEYVQGEDGTITVVNHKTNNPQPLNPTEPKVVNGGKKFVKTNNEEKGSENLERLAGAEFYVKQGNNYLVANSTNSQAVTEAKTALDQAVAAYNNLSAEEQSGEAGTTAKALVDEKQKAYNEAVISNASAYTLSDKPDNALVVVSDSQGRFEVTGLAYGDYTLEEKQAPKGYAKLSGTVQFTVAAGSYAGTDTELQYNDADTNNGYGQQVRNKKVSIPQTGGIGTLVFTVAGLAMMSLAFVAMRRNKENLEA
ncbi:pilin N-terminal domain-containing protein [Anaerococcus sp. AGMB09787]|uniref:pilin N-terminal domain-containing protein n=1 Tax=Anaerococcus sp. AGMB09787 TaxID=2922869 RepID=UPI001FAF814E|nr:pilin N-terminal domain-containing protein [Anaerococcus sp. AGMB09787]